MDEPNLEKTLRDRLESLLSREHDNLLRALFLELHEYFTDIKTAGNDGWKTQAFRRLFGTLADDVDGEGPAVLRKTLDDAGDNGKIGHLEFYREAPGATAPTSLLQFASPNASGEIAMQFQKGDFVVMCTRDGKTDRELLIRFGEEITYEE